MATYKLIQDIEAEDHIIGPFTLRQFIFGMIAIFLFYICSLVITKGVAFLLIVLLPPALFFAFFALPLGRDQPTEIWALAKLRYYFKPRGRVWSQDGIKDLVTITVPKKVESARTNGLSQGEVNSRLKALANTLDSRGWAVKNVDATEYTSPLSNMGSSERLLDLDTIPRPVPEGDIVASDDVLDNSASPIARQFTDMIDQSSQVHRQELMDRMNDVRAQQSGQGAAADYWFMGGQTAVSTVPAPQAASVGSADEAALSSQLKSRVGSGPSPYSHLRTLQPGGGYAQPPVQDDPTAMTAAPDPAILSLAKNDDLNVATLAREAKRVNDDDQNEVVIPLR